MPEPTEPTLAATTPATEPEAPEDALRDAASKTALATRPPRTVAQHKPVLREYLDALMIAVLLALFLRTFLLQPFKIPTGSMETNLLIGDHLLVNKFIYGATVAPSERALLPLRAIRRGDVVVFKFPQDASRDFIKRCVALPGDQVEIVDKRLWVNGSEVDDDSYVRHEDPRVYPRSLYLHDNFRKRDNFGPYIVPENTYFCLGDNRDNSHDSRFWGPVPAAYVKGRAWMVYWSLAPMTKKARPAHRDARAALEAGADTHPAAGAEPPARSAFARTRWARTLRLVR